MEQEGTIQSSAQGPGQLISDQRPKPRGPAIVDGIPGFYVYLVNGVRVVQCPFFKEHCLRASRLQYHLVKCIKNYKGPKLRCPYNAQEYVDPGSYLQHLKTCKGRIQQVTHFAESLESFEKLPELAQNFVPVQNTVPYEYYDGTDECDW